MSCVEDTADIPSVRLECDRPLCPAAVLVMDDEGLEACKRFLVTAGWSLYRGKVLCPYHTVLVKKRSRRRRDPSR